MRSKHKGNTRAVALSNLGILPTHRKAFGSLWLAFFVVGMAWGFTVPLFPVVMVAAGLQMHTYGLLQSYAALASMIAQVGVGRLSDRMGRRKPLLILSLLLMVPVVALFPRAEVAFTFGVLLALHSILQNAFRILNNAWVRSMADGSSLGRMFGTFRIAASLGWIVATPLLGAAAARWGDGASFVIAAVVYVVAAVFVALGIREHVEERAVASGEGSSAVQGRRSEGGTSGRGADSEGGPPDRGRVHAHLDDVRARARVRGVLLLFFTALALFQLAQSMGISFNAIYFKQELGLTDAEFGWMYSLQAWFEVPLMLTLGAMSDRVRPRRLLGVTFALSGLRWFLLSVVGRSVWLIPVQLLHAVGVTVGEVLAVAFVARLVSRDQLATVLGWKVAVQNAAMLVAPALGGYISHGAGLAVTFQVAAASALAGAAVIGFAGRDRRVGEDGAGA